MCFDILCFAIIWIRTVCGYSQAGRLRSFYVTFQKHLVTFLSSSLVSYFLFPPFLSVNIREVHDILECQELCLLIAVARLPLPNLEESRNGIPLQYLLWLWRTWGDGLVGVGRGWCYQSRVTIMFHWIGTAFQLKGFIWEWWLMYWNWS